MYLLHCASLSLHISSAIGYRYFLSFLLMDGSFIFHQFQSPYVFYFINAMYFVACESCRHSIFNRRRNVGHAMPKIPRCKILTYSQERFDRMCSNLLCGLGVTKYVLSTSYGWGGAYLYVRTCTPPPPSPYLRIRLNNFANI